MSERGLRVAHTIIYRWVIAYSPKLNKRCHPNLRPPNDSWRNDGNTIDFLLTENRDTPAAKKFLTKALQHSDSKTIRVINTDKDKAYPKAIKELKESGILSDSVEHRAVKYLNNIIEQDHRDLKQRVIASRTISGYETMNMMAIPQGSNQKCGTRRCLRSNQIYPFSVWD
ncbi:MAG: DDE-type integrase/transposase/recombinase [Cyanobacteria bacterium P01_A01_bin.40]